MSWLRVYACFRKCNSGNKLFFEENKINVLGDKIDIQCALDEYICKDDKEDIIYPSTPVPNRV